VEEVKGLLEAVSQDPEREVEPLGLLPKDKLPVWTHVRVHPVGFDQLELRGDGTGTELNLDRATDLWLGLARVALGAEAAATVQSLPEAAAVANPIQKHRREAAYDQVIVGYLLQLAEELKGTQGGETEAIRKRVSRLMSELDDNTLQHLLEIGGNASQRNRLALDANQGLAVESVLKIVRAAADASHQTVSHSLSRLLVKLSSHAESGTRRIRSQADAAFRENVEELIRGWELQDPNPDDYTLILDSMARAAPVFDPGEDEDEGSLSGAHRLIHMGLELNAWGPTVVKAVSDLIEAGEVGFLIDLADSARGGPNVRANLIAYLTSPSLLLRLLSGDDVHEETLRAVTRRMGSAAIPILLDVLTQSESRAIRRKVFDVTTELGEGIAPFVLERLGDERWYVTRNLLALIKNFPELPPGFVPGPFMDHADERVRREAFPLAVRDPRSRDRALAVGLVDPDERMLRMALLEVQKALPETLVPVLVRRVIRAEREPSLRALAIRGLRHSRSNLALEVLLEVCSGGKSLLGRVRLNAPTPEVLAAVGVLAGVWQGDRRAEEYLRVARKAKDERVRRAASGEEWEE